MSFGLTIRKDGALDLVSLGALVHRLDPGIIPFRKAQECQIHVSGGEFNVAANLADCFGLQTGIATAMVDYPIGDLVAERVKAMGVRPFYKRFHHDGVTGPNIAAVYSDRGQGVRARVVDRHPQIKIVATTLREVHSTNRHGWGAVAWINGQTYVAPECELHVLDRVGGGDGFASGFFYGLMTGESAEESIKLGWAHG